MQNSKIPTIFNYDFDWPQSDTKKLKEKTKEECCEKYKKKNEKKCKSCPNKVI